MKCRQCEYYQFARRDSVFPKGVHYCEFIEDLIPSEKLGRNRIKALSNFRNRQVYCNDNHFKPKSNEC